MYPTPSLHFWGTFVIDSTPLKQPRELTMCSNSSKHRRAKKKKAADRNPKNTLLRVIPPTDIFRHLTSIILTLCSDTLSDTWSDISKYILTFYLTFYLFYLAFVQFDISGIVFGSPTKTCELATLCPETRGSRVCEEWRRRRGGATEQPVIKSTLWYFNVAIENGHL